MNPWIVFSFRSDCEYSRAAKIAVAAWPPSSVNSSWSSAVKPFFCCSRLEIAIAPIGRFWIASGMQTIGWRRSS